MFAKLILLFLFHTSTAVIIRLNESDYARMPPLFHLDNYEDCFVEPDELYCGAEILLVSDEPSELLTMIEEYSALPVHYNRTLLRHGYCMNKSCNKKFYNDSEVDLRLSLEACMNESLYNKYKLKAKVLDNIDCSGRNRDQPIDYLDITVAVICITIVLANLIGSLCDHYLKKGVDRGVVSYLCCFSIFRNWKKLIASPGEGGDPRLTALRGIHGFRAVTMIFVVISHTGFIYLEYLINPNDIEDILLKKFSHIFSNGTLVMQTFLVMSSFLLVYNWLIYLEKRTLSWTMLPHQIIMRWLRLTPAYALILGLTVTWFGRIASGPFWKENIYTEISDCRRDWWKHLLYFNNYSESSHCMPHTWYLAADTQLYIVGVIIFLMCRTGLTRKVVLSFLFMMGMIIPMLHVYFQGLNGILVINPEIVIHLFMKDPTANHVFKRGHTNLIGYVIGMSLGYILYYWQQAGGDPSKFRKYRYFYWSLFLGGVFCSFAGTIFYEGDQQQPLYVHMLFAALSKAIFGTIIAILLAGVIIKFEGLYRPVLEWRPFIYLSRLSYSAYLVHGVFIKTEVVSIIATQKVNEFDVVLKNCKVLTGTFIVAFFYWIMVEAPTGNLIREVFRKPKTQIKEDNKEAVEESKKTEDDKGAELNNTQEDGAIVITMGSRLHLNE